MKISSDFKLIESGGKYFYNGDEYKLDVEGNGLRVFTNKKLKYSIITDDSLKTITVLYPCGDGNFAYMTMGDNV